MENIFSSKTHKGKGSGQVVAFLKEFQEEFFKKVKRFNKHTLDDGQYFPAFWYGERQTRTFMAAALDKITGGFFLQDYTTDWKAAVDKENIRTSKAADYFCKYGAVKKKIGVLMEARQGWIEYVSDEEWKMKSQVGTMFDQARDQLKDTVTETSDFWKRMFRGREVMFGVAVNVMPVYVRYDSADEKPATLGQELMEKVADGVRRELKAQGYGYMTMPRAQARIISWEYLGKEHHQSYPGLILAFKVLKLIGK